MPPRRAPRAAAACCWALARGAAGVDPLCTAALTCTAGCAACCKDYIANCTTCIAERCASKRVCSPPAGEECNVCSACCWDYIGNGPACDQCDREECNHKRTVCVHNATAWPETLENALDWVCGPPETGGGVNCSQIQEGKKCYEPNTPGAHCDFAFDAYWQAHKNDGSASCNFGGAGEVRECYATPSDCSPCPVTVAPGCGLCPHTPGAKCCNPHTSPPQKCYYTGAAGHDPVAIDCCECGADSCECPPDPTEAPTTNPSAHRP